MKPKELLQQNPDSVCKDKYSGAVFAIKELSEIVVAMLDSNQPDVEEFCDRFELRIEVHNKPQNGEQT